jgi:hypothetical protein
MVTPRQYTEAIARLDLSQERAGLFFGYSARQGQRWAAGDAPLPVAVAMVLRLLLDGTLSRRQVERARPTA